MSDSREDIQLSRRSFVVSGAIAGAGLLIGVRIPSRREEQFPPAGASSGAVRA